MARGREQASIREIAKRLDLSIATVSRALNGFESVNEETRRRVQQVADELGYQRRIAERQMRVIGLLYGGEPVRTEWGSFDSAVLDGIREATHARGWDLTLLSAQQRESADESYRQFLRYRNVPGVIVRSIQPEPVTAVRVAEEGIPSVMIANRSSKPGVNYIYTEMREHTVLLIEHLIGLGHRRIGLSLHGILDHDHRARHDSYLEALRRHGIEADPALIVQASELGSPRVGARAVERLLSLENPPTAIFLTDPLSTVGALHRLLTLGIRAPQEVSIVGVDDSDVRFRTFPVYTAVCQDATGLGRRAARWLIESIAGDETAPLREAMGATLSIHDSTAVAASKPVRLKHDGTKYVRA
ncbi:MAG: LacI family DNA-binding transcriptional regulator [Phycisphaerales bacterium]